MYLGIDIGGTKTLVATLDVNGVIQESIKFPTSQDYGSFLNDLAKTVAGLSVKEFSACSVAAPGRLDAKKEIGVVFGNLPWKEVHLKSDIHRMLGCPTIIEKDANLAGLSEAMLLKDKYNRVLYITISTGINIGLVVDQRIDNDISPEAGDMIMERHGKLEPWEHFASGKAIVRRFGKRASDINDEETWRIIAHDFALGIADLIAVVQPQVIVIGGSVGVYFDKYGKLLKEALKQFETPLTPTPKIIKAGRPDQAVVYGCYDLARQFYGDR
jgi:predicted NBD/HSP70 family sugar kinase